MELDGRRVVVTGAAGNLGWACAREVLNRVGVPEALRPVDGPARRASSFPDESDAR